MFWHRSLSITPKLTHTCWLGSVLSVSKRCLQMKTACQQHQTTPISDQLWQKSDGLEQKIENVAFIYFITYFG